MSRQEALFALSEHEQATEFSAQMLLEKCARSKSVILTDEGRVLTLTPSRRKVLGTTKPEWVYPVTTLQEACDVLAKSYAIRNG